MSQLKSKKVNDFNKLTFSEWKAIHLLFKIGEEDIDEVLPKLVALFTSTIDNMSEEDWDKLTVIVEEEFSIFECRNILYDFLDWREWFFDLYSSYFGSKSDRQSGNETSGPSFGPIFNQEKWQYDLIIQRIIDNIPAYKPEDIYKMNVHSIFNKITFFLERDNKIRYEQEKMNRR